MSNLLNNGKPKKRLLDRGPKIVPEQEFKLETTEEPIVGAPKQEPQQEPKQVAKPQQTKAEVPAKAPKKREVPQITSVRVTKATRNKLNALIQLGKADNVDTLIDILIDEYVESNLVKDEKKTYNIILDIIQKRDR